MSAPIYDETVRELSGRLSDAREAYRNATRQQRLPAWLRLQSVHRLRRSQLVGLHFGYRRTVHTLTCTCGLIADLDSATGSDLSGVAGHLDPKTWRPTTHIVVPDARPSLVNRHFEATGSDPQFRAVGQVCGWSSAAQDLRSVTAAMAAHLLGSDRAINGGLDPPDGSLAWPAANEPRPSRRGGQCQVRTAYRISINKQTHD